MQNIRHCLLLGSSVFMLYTINSNWEQAEKRSTAWMNLHLTSDVLQSGTLLSKMPGGDKIRPCTVALVFTLGAQWAVKALQVVRISWPHLLSSFHILSYLSYLSFRSCSIPIFTLPRVSLLKFSPNCFVSIPLCTSLWSIRSFKSTSSRSPNSSTVWFLSAGQTGVSAGFWPPTSTTSTSTRIKTLVGSLFFQINHWASSL